MLKIDEKGSRARPLGAAGLVVAVVVVFTLMADLSLANARQLFNQSLGAAIETIETGSTLRRVTMFAFAAYAVGILATMAPRRARPNPTVLVPLIGLVAIIIMSPLWAVDPAFSFRRASVLALMLVGVFAAAALLDMENITRLAVLFAGMTLLLAVLAQVVVGPLTPLEDGWRLAGVVHPVTLSWYCGLGVLGSLAIARYEPPHRVAASATMLAFLAALLLTKTRTGVVATIAGAAVLLLLSSRRSARQRLAVAATLLALGVFLVALAFPGEHFTWTGIYSEVAEVSSFGRTEAVEQIATFTGRLPIWEAGLQLASERPTLGWGYNAFSSPGMIPIFAEASGWVPTSAHSGFIETVLSLGIVGLAFLVALLAGTLGTAMRLSQQRPYYGFAAAVVVWLTVNLFFEAPLLYGTIFASFLVFTVFVKVGVFPDAPSDQR